MATRVEEVGERWVGATGIVAVALFIIALILVGDSPSPGTSGDEVAAWYQDNRGSVLTGAALIGFATVFFFWFAGTLAGAVRERAAAVPAAIVLAGSVAFAVALGMISALHAANAFSIAEAGDAGVAAAFSDLSWAVSVLASFPIAIVMAATGAAAMRGAFPRWFGQASLLAAILMLLAGTTWARDGFWSPDGAFSWISVIVAMAWILAASATLMQQGRVVQATPAPATPA